MITQVNLKKIEWRDQERKKREKYQRVFFVLLTSKVIFTAEK